MHPLHSRRSDLIPMQSPMISVRIISSGSRKPPRIATIAPQMLADAGQVDEWVDRAKQMICRNVPLQVEAVEQRLLRHHPLTHHRSVTSQWAEE